MAFFVANMVGGWSELSSEGLRGGCRKSSSKGFSETGSWKGFPSTFGEYDSLALIATGAC